MRLADVAKSAARVAYPSAEMLKRAGEAHIAELRQRECLRLGITDDQLDIVLDASAYYEAAGFRGAYDAITNLIVSSPLTASEMVGIVAEIDE